MNFIVILGWIAFVSIAAITIIETINVIRIRANVYKKTKSYKRLIEKKRAEVIASAISEIISERHRILKEDGVDASYWGLYDWYYYSKIKRSMSSERAYQFFRLVERMRDKQKEYFRTKSQAVLNESKQLEREVDSEIQRANNILNNRQQPSLFDGQ